MLPRLLLPAFLFAATLFAQDKTEPGEDTSAPSPEYRDYLVASSTRSPDGKLAVLYPKLELCIEEKPKSGAVDRCHDYLAALRPFRVLAKIETESPYFQNKNHGGISATWTSDSSAVLVTIETKWGPDDILLYEIRDGKVTRSTSLLKQVHDLLLPAYKKAKAGRYNDVYNFIFVTEEGRLADFADSTHVRIKGRATTDPKSIPGLNAWDGEVDAIWDIPAARFTSVKAKTTFAGKRSGENEQ